MSITRLPPGPIDPQLFFDQPREHKYMVSQETNISWDDSRSMGIRGKTSYNQKVRYTPQFAHNDEQLRAVILSMGTTFLNSRLAAAGPVTDWQEINRKCTAYILNLSSEAMAESQKPTVEIFQVAVRHCGSYLAIFAAIAFHYWRRGQDSIAVAEMLAITPGNVRQHAFRMVEHARELGFETYAPHHTEGQRHKDRGRKFLEARRATLRRKLYGSPEFDEAVHCYRCRVNPIAPGQRWHCVQCAARRRKESKSVRFHRAVEVRRAA